MKRRDSAAHTSESTRAGTTRVSESHPAGASRWRDSALPFGRVDLAERDSPPRLAPAGCDSLARHYRVPAPSSAAILIIDKSPFCVIKS